MIQKHSVMIKVEVPVNKQNQMLENKLLQQQQPKS